jgi:hypothetical protein
MVIISGVNSDGVPTSSTLTFNSVTDHIMAPFVACMRPAANAERAVHLGADASRLNLPREVSFKFRNYAERSIRPGERVTQTVLQPEIRGEIMRLFGLSLSKSISPAHLTVLTDCELINIRDDDSQRWMKGSPHGGIWTYIPLGKIASVSVSGRENDLLVLSIRPLGDLRINSVFLASNEGRARAAAAEAAPGIGAGDRFLARLDLHSSPGGT